MIQSADEQRSPCWKKLEKKTIQYILFSKSIHFANTNIIFSDLTFFVNLILFSNLLKKPEDRRPASKDFRRPQSLVFLFHEGFDESRIVQKNFFFFNLLKGFTFDISKPKIIVTV